MHILSPNIPEWINQKSILAIGLRSSLKKKTSKEEEQDISNPIDQTMYTVTPGIGNLQ